MVASVTAQGGLGPQAGRGPGWACSCPSACPARLRAHAQRARRGGARHRDRGLAVLAMTSVGSVAVQDRAAQQAIGDAPAVRPRGPGGVERRARPVRSLAAGSSTGSRAARCGRCSHREPFAVGVVPAGDVGRRVRQPRRGRRPLRWLVLRSGKLPAPCTPTRCELVQIGGRPPRRSSRSSTSSAVRPSVPAHRSTRTSRRRVDGGRRSCSRRRARLLADPVARRRLDRAHVRLDRAARLARVPLLGARAGSVRGSTARSRGSS